MNLDNFQGIFLLSAYAGISYLAAWLLVNSQLGALSDFYSFNLDDIRFSRTVRELEHTEAMLRFVRRDRERVQGIPAEWQLIAIMPDTTPFELEWMLVSQVWGGKGKRFYRYRLEQSPFKQEILAVERQLINQVQTA